MILPNRLLGPALAAALLFPCAAGAQPAAGAGQPASPVSAGQGAPSAAPATSSEPAAQPPAAQPPTAQTSAPPASPPQSSASGRVSVALIITPELKAIVWSHSPELLRPMYEVGDVNRLGEATDAAIEDMLEKMPLDLHVVASADEAAKLSSVTYYLQPTLQRYEEHNQGLTTFAPFTETIVVQWKVTDAKRSTVLEDTALATATGKLGNNFIANSRAQKIENEMLDQLKSKSVTLLQPVLVSQ